MILITRIQLIETMKKTVLTIIAIASTSFFNSCANSENQTTGQRFASGVLMGAALGAVIGKQSGEAGKGAVIGAAAGGLNGYATAPNR